MRHKVEAVKLKSGAEGLLIDVPDASVMDFSFNFRAGNRFVRNKSVYETAHIMEHLAFGANAVFGSEQEYEAEFTKNGAYHNAYTGRYTMGYIAECADFEWQRILELQRPAIVSPRFNEAELNSERSNVKNELTGYKNSYNRLLWMAMSKAMGEDVLLLDERLKTLANVTLADVQEHHRRTHTAKNMRFIISGKLPAERKAEVMKMLNGWELPSGEYLAAPVEKLHKVDPDLILRQDAANLTFGLDLSLSRRLSAGEIYTMECLEHILTGTMNSKIFGTARKKGLVYGLYSGAQNSMYGSEWEFGGEVNYDNAEKLFKLISTELGKILAGEVAEADVEAAKTYLLGRHQMSQQTVGAVGGFYMDNYFDQDVVDNYKAVPDLIRQVSPEAAVKLAREFAAGQTWGLYGVGSCGKVNFREASTSLQELLKP